MFFPNGGGLDMACVSLGSLPGTIEIGVQGGGAKLRYVVRPTSLHFESVSEDPQWNYLRLETEGLDMVTSDVVDDGGAPEEVVELRNGSYAPRSAWDVSEYQGVALPSGASL